MSTTVGNPSTSPLAGATPALALRRTSGLTVQDVLVFIIPLSGFIELQVVGRLFAPDTIMLVLFPFLVLSMGRRLAAPLPRMFIIMGLIWLLGQVATDVIRSTSFHDFSRGWANIIFTLTNFSVIYLLINNRLRRIILYGAGLVGSGLLSFYVNPNIYASTYPWKFGVGGPLTLLVILIAVWVMGNKNRHQLLPIFMVGLIGLFNVYMGFRSLGGVCLLTAVYLIAQRRMQQHKRQAIKIRYRTIVMLGMVLAVGSFLTIQGYEYAARSGMLGNTAKVKYEAETGEYGLLIGGRTEILVSIRAVMDSPIIGYGSWAKNWHYAEMLNTLRRKFDYASRGISKLGLIPTHSYLMGGWVDAGILGAVFWLWVLFLPVRTLTVLFRTRSRLAPLIVFLAISLIWEVLFSPYGSKARFEVPYYVIVMMMVLSAELATKSRRKMP